MVQRVHTKQLHCRCTILCCAVLWLNDSRSLLLHRSDVLEIVHLECRSQRMCARTQDRRHRSMGNTHTRTHKQRCAGQAIQSNRTGIACVRLHQVRMIVATVCAKTPPPLIIRLSLIYARKLYALRM